MYIFNTYSAASGSLNASHKCEIAQQQRDGEIQVNKHVNSMEELLSVKSRVQIRAFTIMKFASDMYSKHQGSYSMTQGSCLLHILFPWFVNTLCLLVACLHGITLSVQQTMLPPPPQPPDTQIYRLSSVIATHFVYLGALALSMLTNIRDDFEVEIY